MKSYFLRTLLLSAALFFCSAILWGQQGKIYVRGKVFSDEYRPLVGATVYLTGFSNGTYTDSTGSFMLELQPVLQTISFSYIGYQPQIIELLPRRDTVLEIVLATNLQLEEVDIVENKILPALSQNAGGQFTLKIENITSITSVLGEHDVVRAIQMLPGVQSGNEGVPGIFIRGGNSDQNLILLDGGTVYNPSHLYGFVSVFNSDAIASVNVYKSDFPAQYGGRLGSVLEVNTAKGDTGKLKGSFSAGFIASRLHLEGPIKKPGTVFSVSARGCYIGAITAPLSARQFKQAGYQGSIQYYFYDINARLDHSFDANTSLTLAFFMNDDRYRFATGSSYKTVNTSESSSLTKALKWKNFTASAILRRKLGRMVEFSQTAAFSRFVLNTIQRDDYEYRELPDYRYSQYNILSHRLFVNEITLRPEFSFQLGARHLLKLGLEYNIRQFETGKVERTFYYMNNDSGSSNFTPALITTHYVSLYAHYDIRPVRWLQVQSGIRLSAYRYGSTTMVYPQYRVNVAVTPANAFGIRGSISSTNQPLHALNSTAYGIIVDYWVPATKTLKPETGWQASAGITGKIARTVTWSVDAFYRTMAQLVELREGGNFIVAGNNWQQQVVDNGTGKAYGAEVFLAKSGKKLNMQFAYTLQWSKRKFAEMNNGQYFPYRYDRRHNIAIGASYIFNEHWDVSLNWVYGSGNMYTLPTQYYYSYEAMDYNNYQYQVNGVYPAGGEVITSYNGRNSYRLPAYHHLDIGCNYRKQGKKVQHTFNISIYNVYSRQNIFSVYADYRFDATTGQKRLYLKQLSLFPVLPSLSYTINFAG